MTTLLMLLPSCIRSKPLLMSASGMRVRDHRVDLDLALHVPVDDLGHVGTPAGAAEGGALPDAAGDKLERTRRDFRAGGGDADDDGLAPTAVAGFQRLAHHGDVAGAVEGVVGAADLVGAVLCHVDQMGDEIAAEPPSD